MAAIIAVNGKGGTGKTTVSALIVGDIASKRRGSLLAIDADPNSTLAETLGVKVEETMVDVIDETSKRKDELPAGMTKDRFIEMKIQEAIAESEGFDLLAMGRPEGPGCYCYVNSVLRGILNEVTKSYDFIVIDNAAGMEHISRRTERAIDKLVLVSDYSVMGIRSSVRIYDLAKEMHLKIGKVFLIVNKLTGPITPLMTEIDSGGIPFIGAIEYDENLASLSLGNRPLTELKSDRIKESISKIVENILEEQ